MGFGCFFIYALILNNKFIAYIILKYPTTQYYYFKREHP